MINHLKAYCLRYLLGLAFLLVLAVFAENYWANRKASKEMEGLFLNHPEPAPQKLNVCIYSAHTPIDPWQPGGAFFITVATDRDYACRIDADSVKMATEYLRRLRNFAAETKREIGMISVMDHSAIATPQVCGQALTPEFYDEVEKCVRTCGTTRLNFLGCAVAASPLGVDYANRWAAKCGVNIWAATRDVSEPRVIRNKRPGETWTEAVIRDGEHREFRGVASATP